MLPLDGSLATPNKFTSFTDIPIGLNYKIAVVVLKSDGYYYYETAGSITKDLEINATMTPLTLDQLKNKMNAL